MMKRIGLPGKACWAAAAQAKIISVAALIMRTTATKRFIEVLPLSMDPATVELRAGASVSSLDCPHDTSCARYAIIGRNPMISKLLPAIALTLALVSPAMAAGSSSSSRPPAPPRAQPSDYDLGVKAVRSGDYQRALVLFQK